MCAYHIGRKFSVGLSKETTRGVCVIAAQYWVPKMDITYDDKVNIEVNDSSIGVIADAEGQDVVGTFAEGSFGGRIQDGSFGLILLAALGTETSSTLVSGAYDHLFSILDSAISTSLTIHTVGPNENSGNGHRFTLAMVDSLEVTLEVNQYAKYKVGFQANTAVTATNTISFQSENYFLPQNGSVKIASSYSGLGAAQAISLRKCMFTISKNLEEDRVIGSLAASDRLNRQFQVEGSLEIVYTDRSYIDTIMIGDLTKALRVAVTNTAVTIGSTNPALTFDFAKVKLQEVARKLDNDGIVTQTVKFKAYYSIPDSLFMTATLRNSRLAVY